MRTRVIGLFLGAGVGCAAMLAWVGDAYRPRSEGTRLPSDPNDTRARRSAGAPDAAHSTPRVGEVLLAGPSDRLTSSAGGGVVGRLPSDAGRRRDLLVEIERCSVEERLRILLGLAIEAGFDDDATVIEHTIRLAGMSGAGLCHAIQLAGRLGTNDTRIDELLGAALIDAVGRDDAGAQRVRRLVESAISDRDLVGPSVVEALDESLRVDPSVGALIAVRVLGKRAAGLEPVLQYIVRNESDHEIVRNAASAYAALALDCDEWESVVSELLSDSNLQVRRETARSLARSTPSDRSVGILAERLDDPDWDIRVSSFGLLWRHGSDLSRLRDALRRNVRLCAGAAEPTPRVLAVNGCLAAVIASPRASREFAAAIRAIAPTIRAACSRPRVAIAYWCTGGDSSWVVDVLVESLATGGHGFEHRRSVLVLSKIAAGESPFGQSWSGSRSRGRRMVKDAIERAPTAMRTLRLLNSNAVHGLPEVLALVESDR